MTVIESLPERPIYDRELERLRLHDDVGAAHYRYYTGELPGEIIGQFTLLLEDGRGYALHFDLDAREWSLVDSIDDYDDHAEAIEVLDVALEDVRGNDEEYGKRLYALSEGEL